MGKHKRGLSSDRFYFHPFCTAASSSEDDKSEDNDDEDAESSSSECEENTTKDTAITKLKFQSQSPTESDATESSEDEVEQTSSQIVQGQVVEELEIPFGVDFGGQEEDPESGEDWDMSPGEEEEDEMKELKVIGGFKFKSTNERRE